MTGPSVLTYARYFNLTIDHTLDNPLSAIDTAQSRSQSPTVSKCDFENVHSLVKKFEEAAEEYISFANDDSLPLSQDAEHHLKVSTSYNNNDLNQIYRDLLPSLYGLRKLKFELPLVIIGGGDVQKDVQKIRQSVDTRYVLDDFLEDREDKKDKSVEYKQKISTTLMAELLQWSKDQVRAIMKDEKMNVTREVLGYMKEALATNVDSKKILETMQDLLPRVVDKAGCDASPIGPDDFPVEAEDKLLNVSRSEDENFPPPIKQEHNILSRLEAAVEEESFLGSTQVDREMEELLQEFTHHDATDMDNLTASRMIDEFYDEVPSVKKRKLEHHSDGQFLQETTQHTARSKESTELTDLKINGSEMLDHNYYELQDIDIPRVLALVSGPESLDETLPNAPFHMPTIHEAIIMSMPAVLETYEKYLTDGKKIRSSDELLWNEPGVRLLDHDEADVHVVLADDFAIEETEHGGFVIKQASNTQPLRLKQSSCGIAGDQSKDTGFKDGNKIHVVTSKSLPPAEIDALARTPLLWKAEEMKPESKMSGDDFPPATALYASMKAPSISPNASTNPSGIESEAASFRSLLPRSKLPRLESNMAVKKEYKLGDSLAKFLDLRGKQFIPPILKQDSKRTADIIDDPIQLTQDLPNEKPPSEVKSSIVSSESTIETILREVIPPTNPLYEPRTVVVNNTLLQTRKLLIQSLDNPDVTSLKLIYRDLDVDNRRGPDIILNPTACLFITSLQSLNQRPLPGQTSTTGLSTAHDQIASLAPSYSQVIVLVHHIEPIDPELRSKTISTQASLSAFCQGLSQGLPFTSRALIQVHWLPCADAASTSKVVNAWVWQAIASYGYRCTTSVLSKSLTKSSPDLALSQLIQEETLWEVFLCKTGLNPMAAQVVLGTLRKSNGGCDEGGRDEREVQSKTTWGLRRLAATSPQERVRLLAGLVGLEAVKHLNQIFADKGHAM